MRLVCVNIAVPEETTRLLRTACAARGVDYVEIYAPRFEFAPEQRLVRGDMLFRPAVGLAARRAEQFLWTEGVATFHRDPGSMFADIASSPLLFQRAGLPIPRTVYVASTARDLLDKHVRRLGGYPVVVKTTGGEGGIGVLLAESRASLYALADHLLASGSNPLLCAYIPAAVHWRVVVVGDRAVAAYRNLTAGDDFRTHASADPGDYTDAVSLEMERIAVEATRLVGAELGGVDLLIHESGRVYLLEANFPCYFAQAQEAGGIDVAGAMLDHLIAKARILAPSARPGQVRVID